MYLSPPTPTSDLDLCPFKGGGSVGVDLLLLPLFVVVLLPLFVVVLCLVLVLLFSTLCSSSFAIILMGKRELVGLL